MTNNVRSDYIVDDVESKINDQKRIAFIKAYRESLELSKKIAEELDFVNKLKKQKKLGIF